MSEVFLILLIALMAYLGDEGERTVWSPYYQGSSTILSGDSWTSTTSATRGCSGSRRPGPRIRSPTS